MYKLIGADGKEYGPISLEQLKQWATERRLSLQTRVQNADTGEWKIAGEFPELAGLLAPGTPPPPLSPLEQAQASQTLAITSLVLGISSVVLCLNLITAIPAIICGHIAYSRARRLPRQYGGAGLAVAGFALGYLGLLLVPVFAAMLLPALAKAKARAQEISCVNNLKQVGLAFKVWELDHGNEFPFNLSASKGGTLELCSRAADGYDQNSAAHFQVLSNELVTPKILLCPADNSKQVAADFLSLRSSNITYQVRSGKEIIDANPQQVLAICPVHGTILLVDGSVHLKRHARGNSR